MNQLILSLVSSIQILCANVPYSKVNEEAKLQCFDYYTNCLVNNKGDVEACKKQQQ